MAHLKSRLVKDSELLPEPLWSEQAEQAVLGAMMISPGSARRCLAILRPEDFYRPAHQTVYAAIQGLAADRLGVDLVTVKDALLRSDRLEFCGGVHYLVNMAEGSVKTPDHADSHGRIVKDYAQAREIRAVCDEAALRIESEGMEGFSAIRDKLRAATNQTAIQLREPFNPESLNDFSREKCIPFLGPVMREKVLEQGGLKCGGYSVLAAFRGVGKSLVAVQTCRDVANAGGKVLYVSNEMSERDTWKRRMKLACGLSQCDPFDDQADHFGGVLAQEKTLDFHYLDIATRGFTESLAMIEGKVSDGGFDLVVLDYWQLMLPSAGADFGEQARCAKELKDLTQQQCFADVCLLVLSQVTITETGAISTRGGKDLENHAQFVGYLKPNKEVNDKRRFEDGRWLTLHVGKNRNGLSDVNLHLWRDPLRLTVQECEAPL